MKFLIAASLIVTAYARNLQDAEFDAIATYAPNTDVRDQLRIDLDVQAIMELYEDGSIEESKAIYENGAFSKSVSDLTLTSALTVAIAKGTVLEGSSGDGSSEGATSPQEVATVAVFASADYAVGDTEIRVQYIDEGCYVGSHPEPVTDGCLAATGTLTGTGNTTITLDYTYTVLDTVNVYSVKYFTAPTEYVFDGVTTTPDFKKYVDYYGSETFNDDIIQAIYAGEATAFTSGFNFDFSEMSPEARAECLETAVGYMAVRNYVFRELEHANYLCLEGDCAEDSCFGKPAVHEVDEAVAFWVGSLEGTDGAGEGVLMYDMAENRAEEAGTVSDGLSGTNTKMLEYFNDALTTILAADCAGGAAATVSLANTQNIPLVQSLLKYSKVTDGTGGTEITMAERVAAAMNILPIIHSCSAEDAQTIYDNTKVGATVSYAAVETAVANNYDCLGITADDVGTAPAADDSASADGGTDETGGSGGTEETTSSARGPMVAASIAALVVAFVF